MENPLNKFPDAVITLNDPLKGGALSLSKCLIALIIRRALAYLLCQTNIAMHVFLHSMPELRSFPRYQGILRVSEPNRKQSEKGQRISAKLPLVMKLLQQIIPVRKFPYLGMKRVHFWIFCLLQKIFSKVISVKVFVQEIICLAKQYLVSSIITLKMNYNRGFKKPVFMSIYLTLFIININSKDEKCNSICRNNYCPLKMAFILLKI
jgi:hypothetical protein